MPRIKSIFITLCSISHTNLSSSSYLQYNILVNIQNTWGNYCTGELLDHSRGQKEQTKSTSAARYVSLIILVHVSIKQPLNRELLSCINSDSAGSGEVVATLNQINNRQYTTNQLIHFVYKILIVQPVTGFNRLP